MQISILNESKLAGNAELARIVAALQIQSSRDFAPFWHVAPSVKLLAADDPTFWPIHIVDTEADAPPDALAWHTDDSLGRPYAIIPVKPILDGGYDLGPTISHEYLEMIADPYCNGIVAGVWPYGSRQRAWLSKEVCDPVEDLEYPITLSDGGVVNVSDFILPQWFTGGGTRFSFMSTLRHPLQLAPGGYAQYYQNGRWNDQFGSQARTFRMHYGKHARRSKRQRQGK